MLIFLWNTGETIMYVIKNKDKKLYVKSMNDYGYETTEKIDEACNFSGWTAGIIAKGLSSKEESWEVIIL